MGCKKEVGRFYAPDPIPFRESDLTSINRYVYASNNPYKYVDPTGQAFWNALDWYDFANDVGSLLVTEIVYTAAALNGNADVMQMAADDMVKLRVDAAMTTAGMIDPSGAIGIAKRAKRVVEATAAAKKVVQKASKSVEKITKKTKLSGVCCFVAGTQVLMEDGHKH